VDSAQERQPRDKAFSEALQSLATGLQIMLVSLILVFIHLPLLFIALLAMAIIFSGMRALRSSLGQSAVRELSKDVRFGMLIFVFGMFLVALAAVPGKRNDKGARPGPPVPPDTTQVAPPETTAASVQPVDTVARAPEPPPKQPEEAETCTVVKVGYVRSGPSRSHRIIGLSIAGSEAKVLSHESDYYEVSGRYTEGRSGKGPVKKGTYWIGEILVEK
jgi:hypothetical protein